MILVRPRRLELPRDIIPQRPQRCASTSSATAALPSRLTGSRGGNKSRTPAQAQKEVPPSFI